MKIYKSLMICLIQSDAEGITPATITFRYIHCCYIVAELQFLRGIPLAFGKIFVSWLILKILWVAPVTRHGRSSGCRRGNENPMYWV